MDRVSSGELIAANTTSTPYNSHHRSTEGTGLITVG